MRIKIETERLFLRTLDSEDVSPEYVAWLNDPAVNKYLSCANVSQTLESCLVYVRSYEGRDDKALIGIFSKSNGLHIGNLTLSSIDWENRIGIIGICVGREGYTGKGFGKEALCGVVNYCFRQLGLCCLKAVMNTKNIVSFNLFKGCGFEVEKVFESSTVIDGKPQSEYIVSITEDENSINMYYPAL
ncbi:MAG: hypothetical protein COT35_08210 [Nitrospirae bacterium CG08_land_8_20_14_0_20_52_24]|nr:MAG: hypothetical protein COT35_08210 [Nitrospirae bacterium CG08_land_8_20_14_0_20_52_24]